MDRPPPPILGYATSAPRCGRWFIAAVVTLIVGMVGSLAWFVTGMVGPLPGIFAGWLFLAGFWLPLLSATFSVAAMITFGDDAPRQRCRAWARTLLIVALLVFGLQVVFFVVLFAAMR
jgi:hypothetical protein